MGEIIGTPRWTMVGAVHYVYVATTSGRVYRLIDNGTSLATGHDALEHALFQRRQRHHLDPAGHGRHEHLLDGHRQRGKPEVLHPHPRQGADQRRDLDASAAW